MAPGSQELYVLRLLNLPLAEAMRKLWTDGFLVAIERTGDSPLGYRDEQGNSFRGKERAERLLAALELDGEHIKTISFSDTNTTTGEAAAIPTDRIIVGG